MRAEIHGVVVKKVVYVRPAKEDEDPKVTITLEIDGDHLAMTKKMLDFAAAGPCTWTVDSLQREMAGVER